MNVLKPSPVGIDIPVQAFQTMLYNKLRTLWSVEYTEFAMYGRAYRNQNKDGYSPEVYIGGNEYQEVLFDDTLKASSFFGIGESIKVQNLNTVAEVFLIFMVNLDKIKPDTTRQDEEARIDVEKLCRHKLLGFTLTGIVTGIDNVFREYSGFGKEKIKFMDQNPWHCFRLNFDLLYDINKCN
jgi:hypothetical protein